MNKLKALLLLIFALFQFNSLSAKTRNQNFLIDSLVNHYYDSGHFNGNVLVACKNKVIYKNCFGYTDQTKTKKLKINSVFSLASVSKTFTSTAILMLKERGLIRYNDKISKFFPEFPNGDKITIYHLLTHTSGLANYLEYGGVFRVLGRPGDFQNGVTNDKVFNYLSSINTLRFDPGSRFEYSNSGYFLLSMIVEKVTGTKFHKFLEEEIFSPLRMTTSYVASDPQLNLMNRAHGFKDNHEPDDDNLLTSGGGGVFSTVEDLLRWDRALTNAELISPATFAEVFELTQLYNGDFTDSPSDSTWCYGKGWVFRKTENENIRFHDGGLNSCSSMFYHDINRDYTIIILSNKGESHANHPIYAILEGIKEILN